MTNDYQLGERLLRELPPRPSKYGYSGGGSNYEGFNAENDTELVVGSIFGVRGWSVDEYGRLEAVHSDHSPTFKPGVNHAECWYIRGNDKGVRNHAMYDCSCGYYAYFSDKASDANHGEVQGIVEATGITVIGTEGFRAEKAELKALIAPSKPPAVTRQAMTKNSSKSSKRFKGEDEKYGLTPYRWVMKWLLPSYDRLTRSSAWGDAPVWPWVIAVLGILASIAGVITFAVNSYGAGVIASLVGFALSVHATIFLTCFLSWLDDPTDSTWSYSANHDSKIASFTRGGRYEPRIFSGRGKITRKIEEGDPNIPGTVARFRLLYPDVPIFSSLKQAMAEYPLTSVQDLKRPDPPLASPANTDNFWEL